MSSAASDFTISEEQTLSGRRRFAVYGPLGYMGSAPTRRKAQRIIDDRIIINRAQERGKGAST